MGSKDNGSQERRALLEKEAPVGSLLKIEDELVEIRRDGNVVVEVLVEGRFADAVGIAQDRDLIAPEHVDLPVHDLHPQRLKQAGGEALPGEVIELVIDAGDEPDVAAPGADGGVFAVGKEIKSADPHPARARGCCREA